jgi:hypothetical protein
MFSFVETPPKRAPSAPYILEIGTAPLAVQNTSTTPEVNRE